MEKTITVESWNGDKQVTKEEYIKQWTAQVNQFFNLVIYSTDYFNERMPLSDSVKIDEFKQLVHDMASNSWEFGYDKENKPSIDSNGYYMGDNLTPEQEQHNLNIDAQM